jgi:glycosyltransferase involved in cell wall biosynthesis
MTSNVTLLKEVLNRKDYADLLLQSDVVLLPYSKDVYHSRTSGPFTEALAAAKTVIVTDGTWMSDQLKSYGSGLTVLDRDVESLMAAMIKAVDQHKKLQAKAQRDCSRWLSFHNPERFIDTLMRTITLK